jgi:hypothetical protein
MYTRLCVEDQFIVRFWQNLNFLNRFSKNIQISNWIKIRLARTDLFHVTDGQADMTKPTVSFRIHNFGVGIDLYLSFDNWYDNNGYVSY